MLKKRFIFLIVIAMVFAWNSAYAAPADQPKTGQTTSYATGDDGDLEKGVAWPSPRFTDNANGTVTDNLTGLIWLKNANCTETIGGVAKGSGYLIWANALTWSNNLASGACGLSDSSLAGDWRLPNVNELESLVNAGQSNSATWLNTQGFSSVQADFYWSSTTYAYNTPYAWYVYMWNGGVYYDDKATDYYVWPVRSGQSGSFYNLNISKAGTGSGTVTSAPAGIDCGADCSEAFAENTSATLTATPDAGSTFAGWSGDCSGTGTCTVTMDAAKNVTATFTINPSFTVTPSAGAGGSISPNTAQSVNNGATTTFTVTPNAGYSIASTGGTCGGALVGNTYTTNAITANCTVTASFAINTYTVTYNGNTNTGGTAPTDGSSPYNYNTSVTVLGNTGTLVKTGYTFAGWNTAANGSGTAYAATNTFNIAADTTLYAQWTINSYTVNFNSNGGSSVSSQSITYNSTATEPTAPTKTGYTFGGWYSDSGLTTPFAFTTAITADTTLYAKWDDTTPPVFSSASPASDGMINTTTVGYTLSEAVGSGSITFTRTGGSTDFTVHTYTLVSSDLTAGSHSINTGLALVSGASYTIAFDATDLAGNPGSLSNTNVTYDTTSASVTISSPAANSITNNAKVSYTLSEDISAGDIVFTRTGGTSDSMSPYTYTLGASERTKGSHTVDTGKVLLDGTIYTVSFENVKDMAGNSTATVSNTNVKYDITSVAVTDTTPAPNNIITDSSVSYALSEQASAGKVTFTWTGGTADAGSPQVYDFIQSDMTAGSHNINTNLTLVDGAFYTVSFDATDLVGNAATTVSNAMVYYESNYGTGPTGNVDNTSYSSKRVDGYDLIKLSLAFGSRSGDANWNPVCDLDKSGIVDGSDLIVLGNHFGEVQ